MPRKTTLKDIAQEAQVSLTTVSLALRDRGTSRISPALRLKIQEIAGRLDYRPNYAARSLVKSQSSTLGLVIPTLLRPFYSELAQDIIDQARERGYGVIASSVHGGLEDEKRAIDDLLARGADGLIIGSARRHDPNIEELLTSGVKFVLTNRLSQATHEGFGPDYVGIDNFKGAVLAVEHLIRLGHRRIALVAGPADLSTGYDRLQGARSCLKAHGLKVEPGLVVKGDFDRRSGYLAGRKLLARSPRPTAVFAANDHMALGVMEALAEAGLRVPDDLALVGFDDIEMAGLPGVDLTTISQKKATLGRLAVDTLVDKIKAESPAPATRIILDPILVIRRSCGQRQAEGRAEPSPSPPAARARGAAGFELV
jgi:LacI family transcriptional regulator